MRSITRRLLILPPALLLVHFLGFAYAHLVRPLRAATNPFLAGDGDPEPLLSTYLAYLREVGETGLGIMPEAHFTLPASIAAAIAQTALASLGLLALALAISTTLGVAIGVLAARTQPPAIRRWLTAVSTTGLAMPTFFVGALFFSAWFLYAKLTPPGTSLPIPLLGFGWDLHVVMPVLVLSIRPTVQMAQLTAGMLVEEFNQQYVVAARALGHSWRQIRLKDAFRNIYAPVILTVAGSLRMLVGELIVVEWLFDWPGIGRLLAETLIPSGTAFNQGGGSTETSLFLAPAVMAAVLVVFAALFMLVDAVASLLARLSDPRLREPGA
ncbi:MAG TPA: ABC transporter permease [Anaerolineales bacterium]|nr:ABC transporter permease [Anaerolineales bacterium]